MADYNAGWITVPGKGRRWRTADGEYLMQRPAAGKPGVVDALQSAWSAADERLGGVLPGGGTPNPLLPVAERLQQGSRQMAGQALQAVRDRVVVPALDAGLAAGVLPAKETMFARYLTGTSQPLTVYPESGRRAIVGARDQIAIEETRDQVDHLYMENDPGFRALQSKESQWFALQAKLRNRAEMQGVPASTTEFAAATRLESEVDAMRRQLGVSGLMDRRPKIPDAERLRMIRQHNLFSDDDSKVTLQAAYRNGILPRDVQLSLGRFAVKDGEIRDRYTFNELQYGRENLPGQGSVYPDAAGGGKLASDLIELGLKTGVLHPGSGYDIRVPLRRH